MSTKIRSHTGSPGATNDVRALLQQTAQSMDISLEVWNGPGRASDRLGLSTACAECEASHARAFDRCRKRRSYLSRQETDVQQIFVENCPQKQRLARSAPDVTGDGPILFAFGYGGNEECREADANVVSFLEDMHTMLREPLENLPQLRSLNEARGAQADRVHLLSTRPGQPSESSAPALHQRVLDQWCTVLQADLGFAWLRGRDIVATSGLDSLQAVIRQDRSSLDLFARRQTEELMRNENDVLLAKVPAQHPLSRLLGGPADVFCIALRTDGDIRGVLCGLRREPFAARREVENLLLQSLANEMSLKLSNTELVEGLKRFLSNTVKTLVSAIDAKDSYTSGHSERVNIVSMLIGNEMDLDLVDLESLYWSALLHDVGKIGMPESILNKPSQLEDDELRIVKEHPSRGWRMLHAIPELRRAAEGIHYHHERWDGDGYPQGLAGEDIPVLARIISVADAFDAIVSNRSYRKGQSPTRAVELIEECSGDQFDPDVVEALRRLLPLLEKHRWVLMSGQKTSSSY